MHTWLCIPSALCSSTGQTRGGTSQTNPPPTYRAAELSLTICSIFPFLKTKPMCPVLSFCMVMVLSNGLQWGKRTLGHKTKETKDQQNTQGKPKKTYSNTTTEKKNKKKQNKKTEEGNSPVSDCQRDAFWWRLLQDTGGFISAETCYCLAINLQFVNRKHTTAQRYTEERRVP